MAGLLPLPVVVPLGTAFLIVIFAHIRGLKVLPPWIATLAVVANLVLAVVFLGLMPGCPKDVETLRLYVGGWGEAAGSTLGIEIVCDGLTTLMLIMINGVALTALIFSGAYMRAFTKTWLFYALLLLMIAGMNGVVLAGDLFNLFVFIEVAVIASYALVGFGCESDEIEASFKYLVLGTIGSSFILLGVTLLYSLTGHLNMAKVGEVLGEAGLRTSPATLLAAAALLGGLALKAAMVPFHAWLPDAHPSAPAPISAMLSGVLIKAAGVYVLARLVFNVLGPVPEYGVVLMALGTASMVIGVFLAVGQWDFKRLLAYHSISQMGYVVLAIGVAAELTARRIHPAAAGVCMFGGLFHMLNHAAFKSLLFLSSGSIEQQAGTRVLTEMGGLSRRMKVTSFCCRIGALSIAGVPPFNGFFSKLIIIIGLAMAGHPVLAGLAALVALMTLVSFIKVQRYALEGEPGEKIADAREAPVLMCTAMLLLAAVCIGAGLAMGSLKTHLFSPAGDALMGDGGSVTKGVSP